MWKTPSVTTNGYLMQKGVRPVTTIPKAAPLANYTFSDRNMEYLDKIDSLCKDNGINLVLMKAPSVYPHWYDEWDKQVSDYAYEHGIVHSDEITIETKSGIKALKLTVENGLVTYITVNMGQAVLEPAKIPVSADGDTFVARKLVVDGKEYEATCVSMGNPHCVIFTEGIDDLDLEKIGPSFENHELFPDRINTEFVEVIDDHTIKMRVWERGSGETWACGTGTCATVAALTELGICPAGEDIHVQLRGGVLTIRVLPGRQLLMTGAAETVCEGITEV